MDKIVQFWRIFAIILITVVVNCHSLSQVKYGLDVLPNNSYISYAKISAGNDSLKCVTDSVNCCSDSDVGNWRDEKGRAVQQGADEATCLYVTSGQGEVSLNRYNSTCIPETSGLWRCDVPDSSEEKQSIYIYISTNDAHSALMSSMNVTLHTEVSVKTPEFTVTCRTEGGPATYVSWNHSGGLPEHYEYSQIILDTSENSVYENRLRVRGRESGNYTCNIENAVDVKKAWIKVKVAGEPLNLTAAISQSNSTHVNITVSWESPVMNDTVTGYVIYYQPKGGEVSSDKVFGGEAECHLLDGLQRGVTYIISIVALSDHLPSPLVGPVTVTPETSNTKATVRCKNGTIEKFTLLTVSSTQSIAISLETTAKTTPNNVTTLSATSHLNSSQTTALSHETTITSTTSILTTAVITPSYNGTAIMAINSPINTATARMSATADVPANSNSSNPTASTTMLSTITTIYNQNVSNDMNFLVIAVLATAALCVLLLAVISCLICLKWKWCECASKAPHLSGRENQELMMIDMREDSTITSTQVKMFPDYVQRMTEEDEDGNCMLAREYWELEKLPKSSSNVACCPHNRRANRFKNICPYDDSRVCLSELPGVVGSDYINASFINGYAGKNNYIAAQGPMKGTVDHFWRMVWEYKIQAIIMLTRCVEMSREKCAKYWPESINTSITTADMLKVILSSSIPFAEYEIREFKVRSLAQPDFNLLTVTQFHYTAWPDHGVPDNVMSLISFIRHMRKQFPVFLDQPLLVHCSAGVGRTGTFITLDMMMQQMKAESTLSVHQCVRDLRMQRMNMVQTWHQYEFIHHALSELVVCGETKVTASRLRDFMNRLSDSVEASGTTSAQKHYQILENLSAQHKDDFSAAMAKNNLNKNRYPNKLPNEVHRVLLESKNKAGLDYINASYINGYKQRRTYIATQGPLQNTVEDFWRMIWENQCGCIVMLCQLEEDGQESSYCYWPGDEEGEVMVWGRLVVKLGMIDSHGDIVTRKMEVTCVDTATDKSTNTLIVTMIQLISWPQQGLPHPASITSLTNKITHILMKCSSKLIAVICSDGVARSGTFICIHSQLERVKTEGVVDVFQAIKSARIQRPGLIPNTDHYIFCYEVLAIFVEEMENYDNFKTIM